MYVSVESTIYYNTKTTQMSATDIKNLVLTEIANFSLSELSDFNKTMRYSHLTRYIDSASPHIISNDTDIKAVIATSPALGESQSIDLKFGNALILDHPLTAGENI